MGNVVNSVLFPAPIPSYTYGSIPSPPLHTIDGVPCLYYTNRNPTSGYLVYLHGNNSDLGRIRKPLFTWARDSNYTVIAVEYPGYGVNYGSTTPENCIHAALKVLRFARLQAQMAGVPVALVGRSIGSGIASQIAARHPNLLDYLILISPFESIERMAESRIGWMSVTLHDTLNSVEALKKYQKPILILHGELTRSYLRITPWRCTISAAAPAKCSECSNRPITMFWIGPL